MFSSIFSCMVYVVASLKTSLLVYYETYLYTGIYFQLHPLQSLFL